MKEGQRDVALLGSVWSPTSASAAVVLESKLAVVVVPSGQKRSLWKQGLVYALSVCAVGAVRAMHCLLRRSGIKRYGPYRSLREFLIDHPGPPVVSWDGKSDLAQLLGGLPGIQTLVSCIFPFRIPVPLAGLRHSVNVHPGSLPHNRGPTPHFWALSRGRCDSAVTIHRHAYSWDRGEICMMERFSITRYMSEYEVEEHASVAVEACVTRFILDADRLWEQASTQSQGVYERRPTRSQRKEHGRRSVLRLRDLRNLAAR